MRYLGGKHKIAKHFLPLILKDRKPSQWFVEPFSGACNVTSKVDGLRMANDLNHYLIAMFKAVVDGWLPPTYVSAGDYQKIKASPDAYPPELVGFVGVACSFGGKFLDVFARDAKGYSMRRHTKNFSPGGRHDEQGQARVLHKLKPLLEGVVFSCVDYRELQIPPGSIVYCDPPYVGMTGYKGLPDFDHIAFWAWVRNVSMYSKVYVSEFQAPKDFKIVWKMNRIQIFNAVDLKSKSEVVEKLFTWKYGLASWFT